MRAVKRIGFQVDIPVAEFCELLGLGQALLAGRLGEIALGIASSRASFEMVQKAAAAAIPILATVSAPTDLALAVAGRAQMRLIGVLRGDRLNVYTHPERIALSSAG